MNSVQAFHFSIHYEKTNAVWQLSDLLLQHIPFHQDNIVFCCIGTDRSTGDALGPLVGHQLLQHFSFPFQIIGTLERPLHALNIVETQTKLEESTLKPFVVAIDACLGEEKNVGMLIARNGPIHPGTAVKKQLPPIGDISIKGVVNVGGFMETMVLQNTRLHVTHAMSYTISRAIMLSWQRHLLKQKQYSHNHTHNDHSWQQIGYSNFR